MKGYKPYKAARHPTKCEVINDIILFPTSGILVQIFDVIQSDVTLQKQAQTRSTVGNVSDCRYVSDCISRGHEFDFGQVPYFRGN